MSRPRWVGSHLGSVTIGCICSGIRVDGTSQRMVGQPPGTGYITDPIEGVG
jgi:hypothetical protein